MQLRSESLKDRNSRGAMRRRATCAAAVCGLLAMMPAAASAANGSHGREAAKSVNTRSTAHSEKSAAGKKSAAAFKGAFARKQTDIVSSGMVAVTVVCPPRTFKHCAAKLILRTNPVKVGTAKKVLTLGMKSVTIRPGKTVKVHVKLSPAGINALKANHGTLSPHALVMSEDGHGHHAKKSVKITVKEAVEKREQSESKESSKSTKEEPSSLY